jgi:competence ComEA-like helix-hairpin-helix protein
MSLTSDERRALAFIAALLFLSAAVRLASLPEPVTPPGEPVDLAAHIAATEREVATAERMREPLAPGERIDPNTAPVVELARLPRIGPALAQRIIDDRQQHGPFLRPADLTRVPGVGPRMVELASPHLAFPEERPGHAGYPGSGGAVVGRGQGASPGAALAVGAGPGAGGRAGPGLEGGGAIDVNRADAALLATLPGVGPVLAARIVAHRDSAGPFGSAEDLLAVRGVGDATLARLRGRVRTGP